eukprot:571145-Ditylum_brightwellii.AAC.1
MAKQENWNYRSVIVMLNFLVNLTHPELAQAVHQGARFCADTRASNKMAVKHIIRYFLTTQERKGRSAPAYGLNMRPDLNRGLE